MSISMLIVSHVGPVFSPGHLSGALHIEKKLVWALFKFRRCPPSGKVDIFIKHVKDTSQGHKHLLELVCVSLEITTACQGQLDDALQKVTVTVDISTITPWQISRNIDREYLGFNKRVKSYSQSISKSTGFLDRHCHMMTIWPVKHSFYLVSISYHHQLWKWWNGLFTVTMISFLSLLGRVRSILTYKISLPIGPYNLWEYIAYWNWDCI
jgi:hypothetical protein